MISLRHNNPIRFFFVFLFVLLKVRLLSVITNGLLTNPNAVGNYGDISPSVLGRVFIHFLSGQS